MCQRRKAAFFKDLFDRREVTTWQTYGQKRAGAVKFVERQEYGVGLVPQPFRQRQTGEILSVQPSIRLDTEALEHGDQLPDVLRRVPR